jgi:hypothetical protein
MQLRRLARADTPATPCVCRRRKLRSGLFGTVQADALAQESLQNLEPFLLAVFVAQQQP